MIELYIKYRVYRKSRVEASREEIDMVINAWFLGRMNEKREPLALLKF